MAKTDETRDAIPPPPDDPGIPTDTTDDGRTDTGRSTDSSVSDQERTTPMNRPEKIDTARLASDTVAVGEDVATLARQAVEAIRQAADAFAAQAGVKTDEAVATARAAGAAAVDGIGAVAGDARAITADGLDAVGRSVARNPVTALAIAAGAGLLIGWLTRSDARR
jgi:ElaB/YqjD/DUF883 family membrane-anchored ribosome-binding protein